MTVTGEIRTDETSIPIKSLAGPKTKVKVGWWNETTMFSVGKAAQITAEIGIGILGVSECRWSGFGRLTGKEG